MGEFKNCRKCGSLCNDAYKFCPNCGASLEVDKCLQCGAELIEGARFCVNCGACISEESVAENIIQNDAPIDEESQTENSDEETDFGKNEIAEDFDEEPVAVKPIIQPVKKPKRNKSAKMNYIVRIIKNASVFALCTILFALSFCNIIKISADKYFGFGVDGCEVSVSAVDVIGIAFSTANIDEDKYADELEELNQLLIESLKNDYNEKLDKYFLSSKTKNLIHDTLVCYYKDFLSGEEEKGSSEYNNMIIAGVFCFLNILFAAAMFIVSIISLVLVILKKKNRVSKFLYALPAYLFISLMLLFLVKTTFGFGVEVAGAMIATLFFEVLVIIATVILIFSAKKKKVIKNAIPKLVSVAMSIIICACLFAPVFTAKYDLVLQNKTHVKTYTISVDASGLITYLSPSEIEGAEDTQASNQYVERIDSILESLSNWTASEFKEGGEAITNFIMLLLVYATGNYQTVGALSVGYYLLLIVFMLFAASAVWSIAGLFKKNNSIYCLLIPALVLIVAALGCSIGWICIMNYYLEYLACSFTVGGGLISAIVLSIATLIFTSVYTAVAHREKRIKNNDEHDIDVSDLECIA